MKKIKPPSIGTIKAMSLCGKYSRLSQRKRDRLRAQRLHDIVMYAKQHSPYYAALYRDIGEDFSLEQLPPVSKRELMDNWNDWLTDRSVTIEQVREFMEDTDNIGRKLRGRYMVLTTSGSTGDPLVMLCDNTTNGVMAGVNATRAYARKEDLRAFMKQGARTMGVFADGGFYLANSSVRSRLRTMPWKKKQMAVTSALLPTESIVEQLNAFQPVMLGGYPSNLELLIEKQRSGRLHISPVIIMTGGEHLSDDLRRRLSEAFNCYVQTSYSCTEGGTLACECRNQHFHVNDDWVILETVDKEGNPVPDGVQSDKLLITNLFNYTQPFIRYEITDRVIMHREPCGCGNPSPWLELEGRTDDVVTFTAGEGSVSLPPLALYAVLKEVHELRRFQLVVLPDTRCALRIEPADGITREEAFARAKEALLAYLAQRGITATEVALSVETPKQQAGSGKFKHIINKSGER